MTNQEYFLAQLGFAPGDKNLIESSLTDQGLVSSAVYDVANMKIVKTGVLNALYILLSTADVSQGTGETVNSFKYDRNAILKRIGLLETELGVTADIPVIKGISPW